ncbi:hypothetical protein GCM10008014_30300 [Paenibacillus silvae]|uniref:Carbamoyltransferase n=1 Tax=Paenibacillus silvae TaxID=1325358 RepID=A0ABQ1ZDJ8_9BACL|nr:carbamoyltransferase C-terminal domain-containing protein [Paenibacillus silvae]GGH58053.1 hypothetical protein GCM10008014_30300 [Paenibacillus silvae]
MRDGYYLAAYLVVNKLAYAMDISVRHDHNLSLWKKTGEKIELVHYWELERLTRNKGHYRAFKDVVSAKKFINTLLNQYDLSIDDMVEVWGTPELATCSDYHSYTEYPSIAYHSVSHLFSGILTDSKKFYEENIIGFAVDGSPDVVVEPDNEWFEYTYCGCIVNRGQINIFPVMGPGALWQMATFSLKLREGTLMALANASKSEMLIDYPFEIDISEANVLDRVNNYVEELIAAVNALELKDEGVLFNYFDPSFTIEENKISMVMKVIQKRSIEMMDRNVQMIVNQYGLDPSNYHLSMSGGYALNCPTNSFLMNKYRFKDFIAPPCVNDSGMSLGIALYAFYKKMGKFDFTLEHAYHGDEEFDIAQVTEGGLYSKFIKSVREFDPSQAAEDIIESPIVWLNGRSEIGPRALGNRSIIVDPRSGMAKDKLNIIKQRQWWRPVAPIVLEEHMDEWFEDCYPSPFMLHTFKIKEDKAEQVPAVCHLDQSARIQTMVESANPLLTSVLQAFYEKTGVPIVCNTSLNDNSEPIINRAEEAINFALRKNIKVIYLNGKRVELQNHEHYKEIKPLDNLNWLEFFSRDVTTDVDILAEVNPYGIVRNKLSMYMNHPQLKSIDITSSRGARAVQRAVTLAYMTSKGIKKLNYADS